MASPFHLFRKHQKVIIVIAGVGLLIVWLLGDALSNLAVRLSGGSGSRGGNRAAEVVAKYDGGEITRAKLHDMVMRRTILRNFLQRTFLAGMRKTDNQGTLAVQPVVNFDRRDVPILERNVVHTQILVDAAKRAGIQVSNKAINTYIEEVSLRSLSTPELNNILANMRFGNQQVPMGLVFEELRRELMVRNYLQSYRFALENVLPEQRWNDWKDLNDRIELETIAVPASRLVVNVQEPSEDKLKALFGKYKDLEPGRETVFSSDLPSPKPAFKIPRKVRLDSLEINYDDIAATLAEQVTEEEIAAFYEEHKKTDYIKSEIDVKPIEEAGETEETTSEEPSTETPDTEESSNEEPETGDPPAEEPAIEEPATKDSGADPTSTEADDSASSRRRLSRVIRFAAFQTDIDAPEAGGQPPEPAPPEETSAPADDTAVEGEGADSPPVESSATTETTPEDTATPDVKISGPDVPSDEADEPTPPATETTPDNGEPETTPESAAAPEPAAPKPVEFQPLDGALRDEIRQRIAGDRGPERIGEIVGEIMAELGKEYAKYDEAVMEAEIDKKQAPAPPKYNMGPLAEKYNLKRRQIDDVSPFVLRDLKPLGTSIDRETSFYVWASVFRDKELYQPMNTVDLAFRHEFILFKTSDTPSRVPTYDEARDAVVRAWKKQRASELALTEAKKLADEVRKADKSLDAYFGDKEEYEVKLTGQFAKLGLGNEGRSVHLTQPYGIDAAGPEFMTEVFGMKAGEVKAILNHDRSSAYVVRMVRRAKDQGELHRQFLSEVGRWPGLPALATYRSEMMSGSFIQSLIGDAHLEWLIEPDQQPERR